MAPGASACRWLLLPDERAVEIWRGGRQGLAERLENASGPKGGVNASVFVAAWLLAFPALRPQHPPNGAAEAAVWDR